MSATKYWPTAAPSLQEAFEAARVSLSSGKYPGRLEKLVGDWALGSDLHLPVGLLDRKLSDLLAPTFDELCSTPGVGLKKMYKLVELIKRAVLPHPPAPFAARSKSRRAPSVCLLGAGDGITADLPMTPDLVCEELWLQWRTIVREHRLGSLTLGRCSPCLQHLSRVVWYTPLGTFFETRLQDIRKLRTYGAKRVAGVLESFGTLDQLLRAKPRGKAAIRILAGRISQAESWAQEAIDDGSPLAAPRLKAQFIKPLLEQVEIDVGIEIRSLAENRLGASGQQVPVREIAAKLDRTRARVYQQIGEVAEVMAVRWPEGRKSFASLRELARARKGAKQGAVADMLDVGLELFFPAKPPAPRRGVAPAHGKRHATSRRLSGASR